MDRRAFLTAAAACSMVSASAQYARAQPSGRFSAAAAYSAQRSGASFIVVRNGVVLTEDYPNGGSPDARLSIGAGTRPFATLLIASMVEDRLITLDEPAAMTLGHWGGHPVKSMISIRSLLSGASGIAFTGEDRSLAAAIALEPSDPPGVRFRNDAAPYLLLTEIARRKLETSQRFETDPALYLTTRTLLPIGCVPIGWARGPDGAARFDDGAAVSARGWAAVGELIRREGVWRAQQLASDMALREALRGSFAESRAGFGLWLAAPARTTDQLGVDTDIWRVSSPAPADLAMAAGDGGQRLYISPADGLVIVRQSRSASANWSDAEFLTLVYRDLRGGERTL